MKTKTSFIPVPPPSGYDRQMIRDAYIDSDKTKKVSQPITPADLAALEGKLVEAQWRWLYLSVWFGLRPEEIDGLKKFSRVETHQGVPVLWVYQSKLLGVPKEQRYKPIPCIYPEQVRGLELAKQELDRPIVKTLQKYLREGVSLYGGRKGFTDLMLERGQVLEDISTWLGHTSIDRTWRSYKQRQRVSFRKAS